MRWSTVNVGSTKLRELFLFFFAKLTYDIIDKNDDYKHGNSVIATNRPEYEKSYYGLFKE